jgi:hypothetical protein
MGDPRKDWLLLDADLRPETTLNSACVSAAPLLFLSCGRCAAAAASFSNTEHLRMTPIYILTLVTPLGGPHSHNQSGFQAGTRFHVAGRFLQELDPKIVFGSHIC